MKPGVKYRVVGGYVTISSTSKGTITVRRYSQDDVLEYEKELVESGMYVITASFVQRLPRSAKVIRILHNRLRDNLKKAQYQIIEQKEIKKPYYMQLFSKHERGVLDTTIVVRVNPETLSISDIDEIVSIVEEFNKIEIREVIHHFRPDVEEGLMVELNSEFIWAAQYYQRIENEQREA